ncbi:MAG: FecR family protein [Lentisphaeraceae bacterium]|nr:FecR family protein [Lentisphaeraceae bacterium]
MRKIELFDAYISGELTQEQQDELKAILSTDEGAKDFVRYTAETNILYDVLKKRDEQKAKDVTTNPKKKERGIHYFPVIIAAAACLFLAFIINFASVEEPSGPNIVRIGLDESGYELLKATTDEQFKLIDGSQIDVKTGGQVKVFDKNKISIDKGVYSFDVVSRVNKTPLRIEMSHGYLEIVGTEFSIIDSGDSSWVHVTEGKVKVVYKGKETFLTAGKTAEAKGDDLILETDLVQANPESPEAGVDFGDSSSKTLMVKAWEALAAGKNEHAIIYSEACINLYLENALKMQQTLSGPVTGQDIHTYWALNDVGTCMLVKGDALQKINDKQGAIKIYKELVEKLSFSQCWNEEGFYWKPADSAKEKVKDLEN